MKGLNDYTITSCYLPTDLNREREKFLIRVAGQKLTVKDTYEEAARLVVNLVKDPWYLDRK